MKKFVLIPLLLLSINVYAKTLSATSVSLQTLKGLINSSEYDVEIEEDVCLIVGNKSGCGFFIRVDEERKLLRFWTGWYIAESVSENRLLRFLNKFSRDYIFSDVYANYEEKYIRFKYDLCYVGGIDSENLNQTLYRLFLSCELLKDHLIREDIINQY